MAAEGGNSTIETIDAAVGRDLSRFVSREIKKLDRLDFASAITIVSGGRGLGSGENFGSLPDPLADSLGGALSALRHRRCGFCSSQYQVGRTGSFVAPQLHVAGGISGGIQCLDGMKNSKLFMAINQDGKRRSSM